MKQTVNHGLYNLLVYSSTSMNRMLARGNQIDIPSRHTMSIPMLAWYTISICLVLSARPTVGRVSRGQDSQL